MDYSVGLEDIIFFHVGSYVDYTLYEVDDSLSNKDIVILLSRKL